jgi:hypothetical protein
MEVGRVREQTGGETAPVTGLRHAVSRRDSMCPLLQQFAREIAVVARRLQVCHAGAIRDIGISAEIQQRAYHLAIAAAQSLVQGRFADGIAGVGIGAFLLRFS